MQHGQDLWDKIWRDDDGRIVIWQFPNAALMAWAVFTIVSLFFNANSRAGDVFSWLGSAALIVWSLLELFKGSNYFRRALGLLILVLAVISLIKNL